MGRVDVNVPSSRRRIGELEELAEVAAPAATRAVAVSLMPFAVNSR